MTPTLNCEAVADRGLVERYLANRLSDAELSDLLAFLGTPAENLAKQ